jgi:peptidoglycan DL-endopeptidase CwlO
VALLAASGLLAALAHPALAAADPIADKRARAAQIASQLNSDNRRIDQLSEQFDRARLHTQQVQAALAGARSELAKTDRQARVLRARLTGVAVSAYLRSGQPLALRLPNRADIALATVGRTYEDLAAGNERDLLDAVRVVRSNVSAERATLDGASRDAAAAEALVADLRRAAQTAVANEQALLAGVNGDLAALVAQAQAERQAQLAAQVQADLAARAAQNAAARARTAVVVSRGPGSPGPPPPGGPPGPLPPPPSAGAATAVATARAQLGKPYQWGGAGPDSFDCSGLTMYSWAAAGVSLPHSSSAQYAATTHIPLAALQPGDLVFFYPDLSHVGIYVGGGTMIHAPHTGTVVSYASIYDMGTTYIVAGRVG